ncbi:MAG: lipid IV(A) 3-deoxy-D-manno-octulosonic acid transferase [Proteobacteria bacterium]|nr:lipid IV(A) 3-deoxy-D-manno-octulosonic acid transferase [Pseudomonadota bacterium]
MMRIIYVILSYLLLPVFALYWIMRGVGNHTYWDRMGQRFGLGFPRLEDGSIWVHAVSVGEVQAAVPLVRALQSRFPDRQILITTVTPTGAAHVRSLFGEDVCHSYIPFETPSAVGKFFDAVKPVLALIMETEIWPNLYHACGSRKIPLVLVSARISPKSLKNYRRLLPLFRETLSHGILIAAQGEADAKRFLMLGASPARTWITGNIKFDIELPPDLGIRGAKLRHDIIGNRPVWIAASTHDGEEEQVLAAHKIVLQSLPDAVLILVPRHPERFPVVQSLLKKKQWKFVTRTSHKPVPSAAEVLLGDTMGELPLFYAASDVAFVGGTLVPVGGHNLLEPGSLGLPVITGPHLFHTQDIAALFTDVGASITVQNAEELAGAVLPLLEDDDMAQEMGQKGKQVVASNKGALQRLLVLLAPLVEQVNKRAS